MGAFTSRRNHGVEEVDISTNNAYRYPPKSGCYFGSHFIMGGDRFETTQPEAYLFGENQDLNFLGNRPVPFPYPAPQAHEPTKTLKSLVNIRKDSLKFIRYSEDDAKSSGSSEHQTRLSVSSTVELSQDPCSSLGDASPNLDRRSTKAEDPCSSPELDRRSSKAQDAGSSLGESSPNLDRRSTKSQHSGDTEASPHKTADDPESPQADATDSARYNIEFTFDTDVKCAITVMYFATEEISNKQAIYRPRDPSMNSETFHYKRGANQVFCQTTHIIKPSQFSEEEWQYNSDKDVLPVVVQCVAEEEEYIGHSHMTFGYVEKVESGYALKPLKQKQMVDGLCYLLQEIYGIENKNNDRPKDDDLEDTGSECVICLVEMRDTLILPCRHLCLCNCCADNLRYQASNCPICRSPFRALLQIRAMRKKMVPLPSQQTPGTDSSDETPSQEGVPSGYEAVSLIEALNGPSTPTNVARNPNQRNFPDALGRTGGSLPGTPEASPMVGRRRLRRKTSSSSNRSRKSVRSLSGDEPQVVSEELVSSNQKPVDPYSTLEVIMTDITDPSKSPKAKKFNMPKIKYPAAKSALNDPHYEVINENEVRAPDDPLYEDIKVKIVDETAQTADTQGSSSVEDLVPAEPDSHTEVTDMGSAQSLDYNNTDRYPKDASDAGVFFKPVAHTMVLCDTGSDAGSDGEEESPGLTQSHSIDPMLPPTASDNPTSDTQDTSSSSYSSTDSTKNLLDQQGLGKDKDLERDCPQQQDPLA